MVTRRDILRSAGLGAVASVLPGVVFAKADTKSRFVLVILRGAADGLAIAAPYGDPDYQKVLGWIQEYGLEDMGLASPAYYEVRVQLFPRLQAAMLGETTAEEVNALFKAASEGPLQGILGYEERPLVSTDYTNDERSSIIDAPSTMVINGTQVKVYAWYDNEMGYAHRLVDVGCMVGDSL